jgi:hypothetical protein
METIRQGVLANKRQYQGWHTQPRSRSQSNRTTYQPFKVFSGPLIRTQRSRCRKHKGFKVDAIKMMAELRQERDRLGEAILTLERLATGHGRRRGRKPAWMKLEMPKKPARPKKGK